MQQSSVRVTRAFVERVCTDGESQSLVVHSKANHGRLRARAPNIGSRCMCDCVHVHPRQFSTYAHGWCACLLEPSAETRWHTLDPPLNTSATMVTGSAEHKTRSFSVPCMTERETHLMPPRTLSIGSMAALTAVWSSCSASRAWGWEEMMTRR